MKVLHFSDTHGESMPTTDCAKLVDSGKFDFAIHTGDIVLDYFEQDITYAQPHKYALVLGNHDTILKDGADSSGYHWTVQPTQGEAFNKFFKPYKVDNGYNIEDNTTWWFKNVSGVRIIGLNCCTFGKVFTDQLQWLETQLSECLETKTPVMVFSHYPDQRYLPVKCRFTCDKYAKDFGDPEIAAIYPAVSAFFDKVDSYYAKGLNVLLWGCGHEHCDLVFSNHGYPVVVVGSSLIDKYNDVERSNGEYTARCVANMYEIDEDMRYVRIYRLGANSEIGGGLRLLLSYDLKERKIATQCSSM